MARVLVLGVVADFPEADLVTVPFSHAEGPPAGRA